MNWHDSVGIQKNKKRIIHVSLYLLLVIQATVASQIDTTTDVTTEQSSQTSRPTEATTKPYSPTSRPTEATTKPYSPTSRPTEATTKPSSQTSRPTEASTEAPSTPSETSKYDNGTASGNLTQSSNMTGKAGTASGNETQAAIIPTGNVMVNPNGAHDRQVGQRGLSSWIIGLIVVMCLLSVAALGFVLHKRFYKKSELGLPGGTFMDSKSHSISIPDATWKNDVPSQSVSLGYMKPSLPRNADYN